MIPTPQLTFLPWVADGDNNESHKRLLSARRHQHTALAGHRKHREQQKKLRRDDSDAESAAASTHSPGPISELEADASWSLTRSSTPKSSSHGVYSGGRIHAPPHLALGSSPLRPLETFGEVELSRDLQQVLHYALINQWPAFALSTDQKAIAKVRETAFSTSLSSPHTLYAIIYAGACYQSYFREAVRDDDLLQLRSKQNALKHLRQTVERSDNQATDEMLMTIALLAIHGSVRPQHRPRFTSPLYRDNEFYSSVKFDQTHLRALRSLVSQRGGLAKLKLHGLSNIISMIDTFQSLMNLSKPQFEPLYSLELLIKQLEETWDDIARTRFANQEDGFEFLDDYEGGSQLHQIVRHIRILLETYALSLRNPRQVPDLMVAVHSRRSLQHAALQLDPAKDCLHESARLAIIIFLAELGWTLPVVGGFQARATKLLLDALSNCTRGQHWRTHPDFLYWATVVGGFAARQTVRVHDFAGILRHGPMLWTKDSWIQVKALSLKFLPFEHELTGPCHAFWDEACDLYSAEEVK